MLIFCISVKFPEFDQGEPGNKAMEGAESSSPRPPVNPV